MLCGVPCSSVCACTQVFGFLPCHTKSILDLVWVALLQHECVFGANSLRKQTILQSVFFLLLDKNGWIMRDAWGRKRERPGRLAGCCPPRQFAPYVCLCACVCVRLHSYCNFPVCFYSGWSLALTQYATGTHTHTHFPLALRLRNSTSAKKVLVLTFSWDGLQGPPLPTHTHGELLDLLNSQKPAQSSLLSRV